MTSTRSSLMKTQMQQNQSLIRGIFRNGEKAAVMLDADRQENGPNPNPPLIPNKRPPDEQRLEIGSLKR